MPDIAPLAGPAPQEPQHLLDRAPTDSTATGAGASRGCLDKSLERASRTRPLATRSADARPTLTMQRRLIAGLIG